MTLLDHNGYPIVNGFQFGLGDNANVLDKNGVVVNPTPMERVWGNLLKREVERKSFFDKFIGIHLLDQFGRELVYVREGKGNVIEIQNTAKN